MHSSIFVTQVVLVWPRLAPATCTDKLTLASESVVCDTFCPGATSPGSGSCLGPHFSRRMENCVPCRHRHHCGVATNSSHNGTMRLRKSIPDALACSSCIVFTQDLDQCSNFFRRSPALGLEESFGATLLVQRALDYKVTRSSLKQLEEERHLEVMMRLRIVGVGGKLTSLAFSCD